MELLRSLADSARTQPDRCALVCDDQELTYQELDERMRQVARALVGLGCRPGDRVAYHGHPSVHHFEFLLGARKAGAVPVPLNWRLAPPEILAILADAEATLLLAEPGLWEPVTRDQEKIDDLTVVPIDGPGWARLLASSADVPDELDGPGDVVLQIYTSGTTGRPKGVMTGADAIDAYLATLGGVARMSRSSTTLSSLPLFHIGGTGWVLAGLHQGATAVMLTSAAPDLLLVTVERRAVTTLIAVPTILRMTLDSPTLHEHDLSSLETLYYGAGPITVTELRAALSAFDCAFVQGFGMTECGIATALTPEDHLRRPDLLGSCGRPVADTEVRLVDADTARDIPDGVVGEVWIRSPITMAGYWRQPEATAAALTRDGWLRTGDAALRNEEGYLFLQDRLKDVIITGGENVYSAEVENALAAHPGVAECAVIGVPSARWSETVKAVVVRAVGSDVSETDLIAFCRERLARYKAPTSVAFVEALPRNPSGKVLKFVLRDMQAANDA
ncbi:MAG: Long-chain-fatty-acid--CoA ligase FadD13 [Nocardioidaceae bacterium]|nr:Long-chain-fatty-acid--CoA ligase FadD13 [Nocardioidaceae bacterium]